MTTNINKQTYLGERGKANILLSSTVDGVFSITLEDDGISWEMTMCRDDAMKIARKFAEMTGIAPIVRKGEWQGGELGHCTNCGHKGSASDIWNNCTGMFCPNCGAHLTDV